MGARVEVAGAPDRAMPAAGRDRDRHLAGDGARGDAAAGMGVRAVRARDAWGQDFAQLRQARRWRCFREPRTRRACRSPCPAADALGRRHEPAPVRRASAHRIRRPRSIRRTASPLHRRRRRDDRVGDHLAAAGRGDQPQPDGGSGIHLRRPAVAGPGGRRRPVRGGPRVAAGTDKPRHRHHRPRAPIARPTRRMSAIRRCRPPTRESLQISHFTTAGKLKSQFSFVEAADEQRRDDGRGEVERAQGRRRSRRPACR